MKLKKYLNENNDDEQTFSDMIEMFIENGDKKKEIYYRELYKKEFGVEYQAHKESKPKVSLDKIYSQKDFQRYQDYIKYSNDLLRLKFSTYGNMMKNPSKPCMKWNELVSFLLDFDIIAALGTPSRKEEAWVTGCDKITFTKESEKGDIYKSIVIHELGHILDNRLKKISMKSDLFHHNKKSSMYDFTPAEIFAESFYNYIISPKYLKIGWPDVYDFFNKKVPGKWKSLLKRLLK